MTFSGFDWDEGNLEKCRKHGIPAEEIEALFGGALAIFPAPVHSTSEERFLAIGKSALGRHIFIAFTIRTQGAARLIRPISARYMHRKEIDHYEKETPDIEE